VNFKEAYQRNYWQIHSYMWRHIRGANVEDKARPRQQKTASMRCLEARQLPRGLHHWIALSQKYRSKKLAVNVVIIAGVRLYPVLKLLGRRVPSSPSTPAIAVVIVQIVIFWKILFTVKLVGNHGSQVVYAWASKTKHNALCCEALHWAHSKFVCSPCTQATCWFVEICCTLLVGLTVGYPVYKFFSTVV